MEFENAVSNTSYKLKKLVKKLYEKLCFELAIKHFVYSSKQSFESKSFPKLEIGTSSLGSQVLDNFGLNEILTLEAIQ